MEYRALGNTGLVVSVLGFGAGHIGSPEMEDKTAGRLINEVIDMGINLIDTARSYGESERRIGNCLLHRRQEIIISTKLGYTFHDKPDWSFDATMGTVEDALKQLKTDYLDIVHLHSCDQWFLELGEATAALEKAKEQGKLRVIAYSGENEALSYAIDSGRFGSIQCSVNIFDQYALGEQIPKAIHMGMGIIAKRPLGNAVWNCPERPEGHGHAAYWDRFQKMQVHLRPEDWNECAVRYSAYTPGVASIIAGTTSTEHLKKNLEIIGKGPLDKDATALIREAFRISATNWTGII